jgi:prepilin-type N-terminal cleavage/methylation domain-containing protein
MDKEEIMFRIVLKKPKKLIKSPYGFSLIELMVVIGILAFITLGLVALFSGGVRSYVSGDSQLEAQRNARQAMDYMVRELRHGSSVLTPPSNTWSVEVQIPPLDGAAGYQVTYYWSGVPYDPIERIIVNSEGSNTLPLINDVLNLQFTYPKSSRINILMQIDVDRDGAADITLNTAVNLRNFK